MVKKKLTIILNIWTSQFRVPLAIYICSVFGPLSWRTLTTLHYHFSCVYLSFQILLCRYAFFQYHVRPRPPSIAYESQKPFQEPEEEMVLLESTTHISGCTLNQHPVFLLTLHGRVPQRKYSDAPPGAYFWICQ